MPALLYMSGWRDVSGDTLPLYGFGIHCVGLHLIWHYLRIQDWIGYCPFGAHLAALHNIGNDNGHQCLCSCTFQAGLTCPGTQHHGALHPHRDCLHGRAGTAMDVDGPV